MSRAYARNAGLLLTILALLLYFHRVMPAYEFWPVLIVVTIPGSLLSSIVLLGRLARVSDHAAERGVGASQAHQAHHPRSPQMRLVHRPPPLVMRALCITPRCALYPVVLHEVMHMVLHDTPPATGERPSSPARKVSTVRFTEPTRKALEIYAEGLKLSLSDATEQLVSTALAAQSTAAMDRVAAPALAEQIGRLLEPHLRTLAADLQRDLDRLALETAVARLLAYALIGYTYGEQEARTAEEGALRLATTALAKGQMASFPAGAIR